jgi:hypothetical protein
MAIEATTATERAAQDAKHAHDAGVSLTDRRRETLA